VVWGRPGFGIDDVTSGYSKKIIFDAVLIPVANIGQEILVLLRKPCCCFPKKNTFPQITLIFAEIIKETVCADLRNLREKSL